MFLHFSCMKYIVMYYLANNLDVIKDIEIIKAKSLIHAKRKTARNLEENIVIPSNKSNLYKLKNIIEKQQKTE